MHNEGTSLIARILRIVTFAHHSLDAHTHVVITGTTTAMAAHVVLALLGFSSYIPYLAAMMLGISFSVSACAQWAMVAWLVPEHLLGTAFGMYVCLLKQE